MSAVSREFLMIVKESAFKTPKATPVTWTTGTTFGLANADAYYIRLPGDNQFTMRPRPIQVPIPYGGGVAIDAARVSDKLACQGQLTTYLTYSHAPFLLSWAGVLITGGTAPWTTTEPNGDLASCAIYHGIIEFDGTVKRRVYLGCKVDAWSITISEASTIATIQLQISGSTPQGNQFDSSVDPTSTVFPAPADNNFPVDLVEFIHCGGTVTYGGSARSALTELHMASNNTLARSYYNTRFVEYLRWVGRKTTVATRLQYNHTPDDRTAYEGLTSGTASVEFSNGTHNFTINYNANNVLDPFEDELALADTYWQRSTSNNLWDSTAGSDFTISVA